MQSRCLFDDMVRFDVDIHDLARWSGGVWHGPSVLGLRGFSIDTRALKPGQLFIAIRSEKNDGHTYIADALRAGAAAVMVDNAAALNGLAFPHLLVNDTRRALSDIARGYRHTLACRIAAVTGSVGKTTVKELLAAMLTPVGVTARTLGNFNNDLGLPLSLLAAPVDARFGVFEVGMNHPGELDPLCDILCPDVSIVTCVGPVHIENFENECGIAHEKAAVYRGLRGKGVAVINADDAYANLMRDYAAGCRIVEVSGQRRADYTFRRLDTSAGTFEICETATGESVVCTASLPGDYFVLDATLSAAAARVMGAPWQAIQMAIHNFQPLAMRWNRMAWRGVHMVNDAYNANPVSLRAAVKAFMEEPVAGSRWLVLGGMLELGATEEAVHRACGAFIATFPGIKLVTIGRRGGWIAHGARDAGKNDGHVHAAPDHASAAALLDQHVRAGDAILFKGSRGESVERVLDAWKALHPAHGKT